MTSFLDLVFILIAGSIFLMGVQCLRLYSNGYGAKFNLLRQLILIKPGKASKFEKKYLLLLGLMAVFPSLLLMLVVIYSLVQK